MDHQNGGVKTRQQLADEYRVCRKTFVRLIRKKGIKLDRGLVSPRDQQIIYLKLGFPGKDRAFPISPESSH